MSSPAGPGRWTVERRRLAGALVASCCFHCLAIALWLSLFAGLFSGVPMAGVVTDRLGSSATRAEELVFTTIEFRPKPHPAARIVNLPRTVHHLPVRVTAAVAPAPVPQRVPMAKRVPPVLSARPPATRAEAVAARTEADIAGVAPEVRTTPAAVATAVATVEPAVTEESSAPPTASPKIAELGLWGLDSAPVLLDRAGALIGEVHRRLRIEIVVDAQGKATSVRVDGGDEALVQRIVSALLSAHYAAARCNNLPCSGELVLAYP